LFPEWAGGHPRTPQDAHGRKTEVYKKRNIFMNYKFPLASLGERAPAVTLDISYKALG
jgi:hypothetical protein